MTNTFQMRRPFCVIGTTVLPPPRNCGRTWFAEPDQAERHAAELLNKKPSTNTRYCDGTQVTELLVVQAVLVVRTPLNYETLRVVHVPDEK